MKEQEHLSILLDKYINQTVVNEGYPVYFIKERVATVRNMKLIIYSNDHNPPHFHVKSKDGFTLPNKNSNLVNFKPI